MNDWISVDKGNLPEKKCLASYVNSYGNRRTIVAHYVPRYSWESPGDISDYDEYYAKSDEYYLIEGWYECQENWGDFAMIYVNEGDVTHWMPLPPAPETNEDE